MGLTLIAILLTAFLLPGIAGTRAFFQVGRTGQVDPVMPSLSQPEGVVQAGIFSIAVHCIYIVLLDIVRAVPPVVSWPLADPYSVFTTPSAGDLNSGQVSAVAFGLLWLSALSIVFGWTMGWIVKRGGGRDVFYGPLTDILIAKRDDNYFIMAYVLTKIEKEDRTIGYQGTVCRLLSDEQRFPTKLVLEDASVFYMEFGNEGPIRREADRVIDWIVLSSEEWSNVAFRVFRVVDDIPRNFDNSEARSSPFLFGVGLVMAAATLLIERLKFSSRPSVSSQKDRKEHCDPALR